MHQPHVLIVGQGFAGSLLAWNLVQRNIPVTVVDDDPIYNATKVAAGIIIPVTGRRLAKTHLADILLPVCLNTYRRIENDCSVSFFFEKNVLEVFSSVAHFNEWSARSSEPGMAGYCGEIIARENMPENILNNHGGIILLRSGYVDTLKFTELTVSMLKEKESYHEEALQYGELLLNDETASWKGTSYTHVIFCDGYKAVQNPFFNYVPFRPAKGEILDFRISDSLTDAYIISSSIYILPLGNGLFRAGATYEWSDLTETITATGRGYLEKNLHKTISVEFEITDHKAGIRPAILDRRPCLGMHPRFRCLGMFNGLGTKGALLAPYYANMMSDWIVSGTEPETGVNIRRFDRFYRAP